MRVQMHDNTIAQQHYTPRVFLPDSAFLHNKHVEETLSAKEKGANQQEANKPDCCSIMTFLMFLNVWHYEINLLFALICSPGNIFAAKTKTKYALQSLFI